MTEPIASSTASLTKFSEAMSSRVWVCLRRSLAMASSINGSCVRSSVTGSSPSLFEEVSGLVFADLFETAYVTPAVEAGLEPNLEPASHLRVVAVGAPAQGQHVRVVVLAREPRGLLAGHHRRAHPGDLVGCNALADSAAPQHDAAVGLAARHHLSDRKAEVGIVHRFG